MASCGWHGLQPAAPPALARGAALFWSAWVACAVLALPLLAAATVHPGILPPDWQFPRPNAAVTMTAPMAVAAQGMLPYTYEIVPTRFRRAHWVEMVRLTASRPELIHHAVVYIRRAGSPWLKGAPIGRPFTARSLRRERDRRDAEWTDSPLLLVAGRGTQPLRFPPGMGIYIPAGADLVFQLHLMPDGHAAAERAAVELVFTRQPARERVLILQLTNGHFVIPPGAANYRVEVHGFLPHAALLLGFFPHMHLRGRRFAYNWVLPGGGVRRLLLVRWRFAHQLNYFLSRPLPLPRGAELQAIAWYNNSASNPLNPNPRVAVHWSAQDSGEMMIGFFFVAVPPAMTKWDFFLPPGAHPPRAFHPTPLPLPRPRR